MTKITTNYLNTDKRTFLISFSWKITDSKFIFQDGADLVNLLKAHGEKGIEFIKEFEPQKAKFTKVSKADILNRFSWETETAIYLKEHYYFKK